MADVIGHCCNWSNFPFLPPELALLKALITCLLLLTLTDATRGDEERVVPPSEEGAYETDRPGEIENPFTLPVGSQEIVNCVVWVNGPAREDVFGGGRFSRIHGHGAACWRGPSR
jgi:hypothetical protein